MGKDILLEREINMCQARSAGGVRCAVHRSDVMAAVSIASRQTGLDKHQVRQIFHSLRREGRNTVSNSSWRDNTGAAYAEVAEPDEIALLQEGHVNDGESNPAVDYAYSRLLLRAHQQAVRLETELATVAAQKGVTTGEARREFDHTHGTLGTESNPVTLRENPTSTDGVALDPSFTRAIEKMTAERERGERLVSSFTALRRSEILESVGYNADNGRLEIKNRLGTIPMAYRNVPQAVFRELTTSRNPDAVFLTHIHQNTDYTYSSPKEAENDATTMRCHSCGQFRAMQHACSQLSALVIEEFENLEAELAVQRAAEAAAEREVEEAAIATANAAEIAAESAAAEEERRAISYLRSRLTEGEEEAGEDVPLTPEESSALIASRREVLSGFEELPGELHLPGTLKAVSLQYEDRGTPRRVLFQSHADEYYNGHLSLVKGLYVESEDGSGWELSRFLLPTEEIRRLPDRSLKIIRAQDAYVKENDVSPEEVTRRKEAHSAAIKRNRDKEEDGSATRAGRSRRRARNLFLCHMNDLNGGTTTATEMRTLSRGGKEILVPFGASVRLPHSIDSDGKQWVKPGTHAGFGSVAGHFGVTVDEHGVAHVSEGSSTLRCSCDQYRNYYRCIHTEYANKHSARLAQQLLPAPAPKVDPTVPRVRRKALETPFGTKLLVGVQDRLQAKVIEVKGDVPAHITIRYSNPPLRGTVTRSSSIVATNEIIRQHLEEEVPPTLDEWNTLSRMHSLSELRLQQNPNEINEALKYGPVRVDTAGRMFPRPSWGGFSDFGGRSESGDNNFVILEKDAEGEVVVTHRQLKCECADYAENYDCRHIRAVDDEAMRNFLEPRNSQNGQGLTSPPALLPRVWREHTEAMGVTGIDDPIESLSVYHQMLQGEADLAEETRLRKAAEEEERRQAMQAGFVEQRQAVAARWKERNDPGYSADDSSAFFAHYQEAITTKKRREHPIEYKTSGVLDGIGDEGVAGSRNFGVEIEFDIDYDIAPHDVLRRIGRDLHEAGLTNDPEQQDYHSGRDSGWKHWSFEHDYTVDGEIISPLMSDSPEDWENLRKVIHIVNKHGVKASTRSGTHVHVSSGSYGESVAKHVELSRSVQEHTDVIFRLASNPKRGTHRGGTYCSPNISMEVSGEVDDATSTSHWYSAARRREGAINIGDSGSLNGHIEFRMWDASLDESVMQQQIKLSVAMTERAEQNVIETGKSSPKSVLSIVGEGKSREGLRLTADDPENVEQFHDLNKETAGFIGSLFRKNEDRKGIASLFAITNWQNERLGS